MSAQDPCVHYPLPRPEASVRLFCFPHAGADAYRELAGELPARIELAEVRIGPHTAPAGMEALVRELATGIAPHLGKPAAFFGHSMGAHIAFELARHLAATGATGPRCLLVSGCPAPRARDGGAGYELPEGLFLRGNGDVVRADLLLAQNYEYLAGPPLDLPIHALCGHADPVAGNADMAEWATQTSRCFTIAEIEGDHFLFGSRRPRLLSAIAAAIG